MVAGLLGLRLALFWGRFRGGVGNLLRQILAVVIGAAGVAAIVYLPLLASAGVVSKRDNWDIVLNLVLCAVALCAPFFRSSKEMDPRNFGGVSRGRASISIGIWVSGIFSPYFILSLAAVCLRFVVRPEWLSSPLPYIAGTGLLVLELLTFPLLGFAISALLLADGVLSKVRRVIGWVLLIIAAPLGCIGAVNLYAADGTVLNSVAQFARFGVGGETFAVSEDILAGNHLMLLMHVAISVGSILVIAALWFVLANILLTRIPKSAPAVFVRSGLSDFERFNDNAIGAIAARTITYWRKDSKYRVGIWVFPIVALVIVLILWVVHVPWQSSLLWLVAILMFLLGWSVHNEIAMDSTAFWAHVAGGVKGIEDRFGRILPIMIVGLPLAFIGTSATVLLAGEGELFPAVIGLNIAALAVPAGVASVTSVLWPYPVSFSGDSQSGANGFGGSVAFSAQLWSMIGAVILCLPAAIYTGIAVSDHDIVSSFITGGVGIISGALIVFLGLLLGAKIYDRRSVDLLRLTETFE